MKLFFFGFSTVKSPPIPPLLDAAAAEIPKTEFFGELFGEKPEAKEEEEEEEEEEEPLLPKNEGSL
jgi:hypothetical protein